MKKIYSYIILMFLLFIPLTVKAEEGINKFYMDATINTDGSVVVEEAFSMDGTYNGFDRIINFANDSASLFNEDDVQYGGSKLHNGSSIVINDIKTINSDFFTNGNFKDINGDTLYLNNGYELTKYSNGSKIRIYNSSSTGKDFYLKYTIGNLAILHNDIGELGWNIFSDQLNEEIGEFKLTIHLPNNSDMLRAWAHGPLNGNIKIIDKQTVEVTINNLNANNAFDVRLAFDKEVVSATSKTTSVVALDKILKYEQNMADKANSERSKARLLYYGSIAVAVIWAIGLIGVIIYAYLKYDKEHLSNSDIKYYREFPNTYGPEIVGYLFNKKIGNNDLSAAILNLVYKKIIKVEEIPSDKKKKYKFIFAREEINDITDLNSQEQKLIAWLFDGNKEIELDEFQKAAKDGYEGFLSSYTDWKNLATKEAFGYNFYEKNNGVFPIIYAMVGMVICFLLGMKVEEPLLMFIPLLLGIGSIIYFATITKRSISGNEEYIKWKAFKNFLLDFGNFNDKDLPEIVLWEKYLVYAVSLGCADKLSKTMEIKARELYPNGMPSGYYYHTNFYYYASLNRAINTGVNSAINTAISTRTAAQSSNSSGSGFGGGFSSGGGSFGGGGGGGRF